VNYFNDSLSDPFDCGLTVRQAMLPLTRHTIEVDDNSKLNYKETLYKEQQKTVKYLDNKSKSNGSLMKIIPKNLVKPLDKIV